MLDLTGLSILREYGLWIEYDPSDEETPCLDEEAVNKFYMENT